MLGKISFIILLCALIALAIMFDWLGSRDLAHSGIEKIGIALQYLEETGDSLSQAIDNNK